jgi:hypothetical protein
VNYLAAATRIAAGIAAAFASTAAVMTMAPVVATTATAVASLFAGSRTLGFTNRLFASLLAAGGLLFATRVMPMTEHTAAAVPTATEQPGVGLCFQSHDDDTHRRQAQR